MAFSTFQVQEYKDNLIKKAEELILTGFPEKIVQLNELLATPKFAERNFSDVYQSLNIPIPDPIDFTEAGGGDGDGPANKRARLELTNVVGTKVLALPSGKVDCNTEICELISVVKPVGG